MSKSNKQAYSAGSSYAKRARTTRIIAWIVILALVGTTAITMGVAAL